LRAGRKGAKIFFGNLERGEKDGHFGAHQGGDKHALAWMVAGEGLSVAEVVV
jgi:hypothetical protein